VADKLGLSFKDSVVLGRGSSTGGFTDYALQHGARAVIAVEVGHISCTPVCWQTRGLKLHEQTDIVKSGS